MKRAIAAAFIVLIMPISSIVCAAEVPKDKTKTQISIYVYPVSQVLRMYQAEEIILETRVSTGRGWGLPNSKKKVRYHSSYTVLAKDPRKEKATSVVVSKKGGKKAIAKTPWKIILCRDYGHYVRIHEYKSVPHYPASHGCIRIPKGVGMKIYKAVEVGTPVYVRTEKAPKWKPTTKLRRQAGF